MTPESIRNPLIKTYFTHIRSRQLSTHKLQVNFRPPQTTSTIREGRVLYNTDINVISEPPKMLQQYNKIWKSSISRTLPVDTSSLLMSHLWQNQTYISDIFLLIACYFKRNINVVDFLDCLSRGPAGFFWARNCGKRDQIHPRYREYLNFSTRQKGKI